MNSNRYLIIALIILFTRAIGSSAQTIDTTYIYGRWQWIQSSGGPNEDVITPAAMGFSQELEFTQDGIEKRSRNGVMESEKPFTFIVGESWWEQRKTEYLIKYASAGAPPASIKFEGRDTLFIHEVCNNCYGHIYIRKKVRSGK